MKSYTGSSSTSRWMSKVTRLAALVLVAAISLTGCISKEEAFQRKAREVKACTDAGGEWYNTPGWGENCNFDSRKP